MPTTTANRSSTETISARRPASFASPTIKSLGHLRSGRTPLRRTIAARAARATQARQLQLIGTDVGSQKNRTEQRRITRRLPRALESAPSRALKVGEGHQPFVSPFARLLRHPRVGRIDLVKVLYSPDD